jgi:hypothetical protein
MGCHAIIHHSQPGTESIGRDQYHQPKISRVLSKVLIARGKACNISGHQMTESNAKRD